MKRQLILFALCLIFGVILLIPVDSQNVGPAENPMANNGRELQSPPSHGLEINIGKDAHGHGDHDHSDHGHKHGGQSHSHSSHEHSLDEHAHGGHNHSAHDDHDHGHHGHGHDSHGSHGHHGHEEGHGPEPIQVTKFSQGAEIFMEYPPARSEEMIEFLVHLTRLADYSAYLEGELSLEILHGNNLIAKASSKTLKAPGIYLIKQKAPKAGSFQLRFILQTGGELEEFPLIPLEVHAKDIQLPHASHGDEDQIPFLKEQQWKVDFNVEPLALTGFKGRYQGPAKLILPHFGEHVIKAPTQSRLMNLGVKLFSRISKGDIVARLKPSSDDIRELMELELEQEHNLSEMKFQEVEIKRIEGLVKTQAMPKKEILKARQKLAHLIHKQRSLARVYKALMDEKQIEMVDGEYQLVLRSPLEGLVTHLNHHSDAILQDGESIMTLANLKSLQLQVFFLEHHVLKK